jgi:CheY-like chemotaxis protein
LSPNLLIVEDDEDVRDAIAWVLTQRGYSVVEAAHGGEALDLIVGGSRPDLILLDMNMPVMNGWELARQLRERDLVPCPILVLTAAHDAQKNAEDIGAVGYVGKPFELDGLVDSVERHLQPSFRGATV